MSSIVVTSDLLPETGTLSSLSLDLVRGLMNSFLPAIVDALQDFVRQRLVGLGTLAFWLILEDGRRLIVCLFERNITRDHRFEDLLFEPHGYRMEHVAVNHRVVI